jgi:hypothetical protein
MQELDALFFMQILMPIMDPCHSGVEGDTRMAFYSSVLRWSNTYAHMHFNTDVTVGHQFKTIELTELVRFDGIVIRVTIQ